MKKILWAVFLFTSITVKAQMATDSVGIWAINNDTIYRINRIVHQKIKTNGGVSSAFTMGVAKIKSKLEFKGASSDNQFNKIAKFRLYFGNPSLQQIQNLYMFSTNYSIKDFEVAKFEVKKNARLLTGISTSILGSSVGISASNDVTIKAQEIKEGVYDIEVSGSVGEYCIMFVGNGTGGFGGVFDFTIK